MVIKNIEDLCSYMNTTEKSLKKDLYKNTDCGAWIEWTEKTVTIGSIVEGSDAEFDETFTFPTTSEAIEDWLDELERLTDRAWLEANCPEEDDES